MASNVFAPRSPADIYQESLGVRQKAVDPKQKLEAASARHGVPVNVLLAVAEADGDTDLANIEATARDLGAAIAGGSDLKKALEVKTGDPDRARAIGLRANQLLDILQPQAAPAPKADNGSVVGDLARQFGGTAVSGIGGAVDALGIAAEQGVGRTEKGEFRRFGERVGESIRGAGDALTDSVSEAGKAALQGSTPDGDISDLSSWTLGDDPSARGYAMQLAGVLGSMAPVVAASVLTRNPAVAAAAGGAQGGGAGADEARQSVLDMAEQMDADGAPMLGKAPAYQKAIAEGLDHTAAVQRTADEAARQAFNWTAPVSGLGGAATQRIIAPVERRVSGSIAGAIAGRAALSGAEEATQEVAEGVATRHGTNEATGLDGDLFEGSFGNAILGALGGGAVGAASGAMDRRERDAAPAPAPTQVPPAEPGLTQFEAQPRPLALPAPVPPTAEDTPDVVVTPPPAPRPAGPLGIRQDARPLMIEGPRDPASAEVAPDVIVTPPPTGPRPTAPLGIRAQEPPLMIGGPREPASAEAAPGVIVPPAPEAKVHPGFEKPYVGSGSAPMGPVAPGPVSQQAVGAAPIPAPSMGDPLGILPAPALAPEPGPIPAPPVGTLSAAVSQLAPAPIAAPAPEPRFPDQKAGSSIRLAGTDGAVGDGVFIRETPEGQAVVRVDGEEYTLSPFDFDRARGEAARIDEEAKAAAKGQATAKPAPAAPAPTPDADPQATTQPTIEPIREKAAILRGVPQDAAPDVPGISLKWDAKEGGFIFSRKHVDKVQAAIGGAPANPEPLTVGQDATPASQQSDTKSPAIPVKGVQVPALGFLRDGYDYLEVDGKPSATQTRTTDDGFVVKRATIRTDVYDPQGRGIFGGTYDVDEAKVVAAIEKARTPEAAANIEARSPRAKLRRPIGKNANGRALFEDERGVRSYEPDREDGALHPRYTESVAVKPGGGISIDTSRRGKDYLTPEEWTALEQSAGPRLKTKDEGRAAGEAWARAGNAEQDRDPAMGNASDAAKGAWTAGYRRARKAMDADGTPISTAPEHAAVGVDNRELSEIVAEFNDAEKSMRDGGDKIHHLFDAPAKDEIVRLGKKAGVRQATQDGKRVYHRDEGWMTPAEAKAKIAEWKAHARAQKKTGQNADKVVLSLFDLTGSWSKPWEEAGYQVFRFDIQADPEVGDVNNFSTDFFGDWFGDFDGMDIHAILAACPCTDFASSGSRHFAAKDEDGRTVASVKLVHQTLATIEHFRPALWAIENPVGRIENLGGLPPWRMSFDPFHLGDTYTKNTLLWGRFNGDLPIAPVEPVEGSKMHSQYGGKSLATKNARSATPEGFAYGFFMANNAIDHPAMALANKFDRLDRGLIEQALEAGVAADAIEDAVSDFYYMELDDDAANAAIRDLMNPAPEPQQMQAETEQEAPAQPNRKKEPKTQPAPGILGALSQDKQDRAAELKARLAAKARGQASSGLDPEYITLGGELVALYIEAGTKRFGQMLRDFAETTGLTMKEAQAPMRAAYNHVRDDMDLRGDDVSDMDDAAAVMAEVRAALKGEDAPNASNIENPDNAPAPAPAAQTPATGRAIAATTIKADTAITARGREVSVDYAIVELADLIPSQRDDGRDNPAYPQELQPRDRSTNKSQEQVRKIASGLKPALLGESPQASNGAPIILPTGEVLSGNGRTLALRAAYADDGKQARAYRDFMDAQGYPEGRHRQPVLVRIVTDPMTMAEAATFAREANERDQADMSVPEQAMADAKNLTPAVLDLYRGGDVDSAANAGFAKAFGAAVLSPNDAGRMRDNDGRMTQDALRRINAALLAKAYGDAGIVSSVLESTDTNIKAIGGALTDVAPLWAQMRAEVERGTIAADADRTADLVEAVKLVDRARRENRPLSDFLNQTDMFAGDSVSPGAVAFLGLFYRDVGPQPFRRALGRDKMADGLSFYAGEALKTTPGVDLLGESADTQAILTTAKGRINDQQEQSQDLFGQRSDTGSSTAASGSVRGQPALEPGQGPVRGQGGSGLDQGGLNGTADGPADPALAGTGSTGDSGRGNGRGSVSGTRASRPAGALAEGRPGSDGTAASGEGAEGGGDSAVGSVPENGSGQPAGGNGTDGRPRGRGKRVADPQRDKPAAPAGRPDYVLTDPEKIIGGGPKARFARNRAAIEAIQSIEVEGREPTQSELDSMAAYIGWGSFGQELFQGSWDRPVFRDGWKDENQWLRDHLGEAAWKSAQESIVNAHYTDPPTVMAMWDMARMMGFKGGRVLEPSMGIGNFFSMMPADMAAKSDRTGIELDKTTGAMAKVLFPQANISVKGYQDSLTPDGFYDLVIGNWPFAKEGPVDRRYDRLSPSLHDYFFLKAIDQTRPGGLVIGITSAGTMDKKGRAIRLEMAKNADLVAAFRLPSGAFKEYAGTAVVTDIIILKKRAEPNLEAASLPWIETADYAAPNGTIHVNRHFLENPESVLGTLDFGSGTTYGRAAMIVHRPDDLMNRLMDLRYALPSDAFTPIQRGQEARFKKNMTEDREGAVTISPDDDGLYVVQGERLADLNDLTKYRVKDAKKTAKREAQVRALVKMRKAYGALLDAERLDGDTDAARAALKKQYDAFRKAHGTILGSEGDTILSKVKDPFVASLRSLERRDGTPAAIMSVSTMRRQPTLGNVSVPDAYVLNRNQSTTLDMEAIAASAETTVAEATDQLIASGAVLRIPGGAVEPKDTYLSGNVRRKLREVLAAIDGGEAGLEASAEALRGVQPAPVPYYEIEARFGAPWVRMDDYRQFIADMIGVPSITAEQVDIRPVNGSWRVVFKDRSLNRRSEARSGYGVSDYPFSMLVGAAMGNRAITLRTKDRDGNMVVDDKRTAEANAAATKIRERFQEWVWEDPVRTQELESAYNDVMRGIADPQYDGDFLTFPGMALTKGENPFSLRKHQRDAIWRGVFNERGLFAHEVGTGKTYTMAGIAVESRRYGKATKPLIVAHNANSAAVYAEAQEMYPGGRFLYIDNMDRSEIETTMRRIANDDWDAVVIPHSLLPRIGFKRETLDALAAEEIAALEAEALDAAEEDGVSLDTADMDDPDAMKKVRSVTAKNLVKQRNQIKQRIDKMAAQSSREGAIAFEDLGIDMVLVDEAHEFKKPPIATRMQMKGLNTNASDRSVSLKLITDYVKAKRGGTGIHLFTGTPITNALNEIFNMMRYVMDSEMKRDGVESWDLWFNTFADASNDVEVTSSGEFEAVTRLAQFVNVAELRRMAGQVLDIVFASDMPEFKPRETASGKIMGDPTLTDAETGELLNGRSENPIGRPYKIVRTDVGQMSPGQRAVMNNVVQWSRHFKSAGKKQRREYMLSGAEESPIIHEGIAAKAGLDVRLWDASAADHPDNKVNRSVANIMRHFRESEDGTQVVFVEQGYKARAKPGQGAPFSLVDDLVQKVVAQGIPEHQIAVVAGGTSAEKKKAIADAMNRGEIRLVIGQTGTLGVGVNMQVKLRAMHHLDAPWMPGDLEQRNGRGERQGNTWNTVYEYRYLTEGIDGRRWQVLAVKDRFIKAFLRADDSIRVIEGDAVESSEGESGDSIAATLSEATGDPRLLQLEKLKKDVERLEVRERQHRFGVAQAMKTATREREKAAESEKSMAERKKDAAALTAIREAGTFTATIDGKTFDARKDAEEAFEAAAQAVPVGPWREIAKVQGFSVVAKRAFTGSDGVDMMVQGSGQLTYDMGRPSIRSVEAALRNIVALADFTEKANAEARAAADRLDAQGKRPFAHAAKLTARRKLRDDLEQDLSDNPAAPPAWLRHGSPIGTEVFVAGKPREVQGHRWTDDGYYVVTEQGLVPYLDARAESGSPIYDKQEFKSPVVDIKPDKELRAGGETITPAQARTINAAARTELALVGLLGKIGLRVEAGRLVGATGTYSQGVIGILRNGSQGWRHTLDHEIVHALRDPARWGGTHGLFTADEWRAMVRAARADAGIRDRVEAAYPDLDAAGRAEEMVAELYADWAAGRREVDGGPLRQALDAIRSFFRAMASVLRGEGFQDAARIMERIASGEVGGRGQDGPDGRPRDAQGRFTPAPAQATVREQRDMGAIREALTAKARKAGVAFGFEGWRKGSDFWSDMLTDTMSKSNKWNTLSLVPGRPLFKELGRNLMAAQAYTKHKDEMDAQRGEWHSRAAETADAWMKLRRKDSAANAAFMDLLHDATIAQVDPTKAFEARKVMANDPEAVAREAARRRSHVEMAQRFRALPPDFKDMWAKVRADYDAIGDAFEAAILKNMELAAEVAIRRAKRAHVRRLEEIEDEGLAGAARDAAITEADAKLAKIESTAKVNGASRLTQLRKVFESNRLAGPYVPLARYGNFFVTVRDEKGAVTSFSMFETAGAQRAAVADAEKDAPGRVQHGVMTDKNALKQQVDPSFVADVEGILASTGATPDVMDAIWQRWLETLPDQSIRTSKIHRKGRKGYGKDALRAYGDHLFHGSHQLAKLEWGLRLEDDLDEATEEAKRQPDPNRAQAIVNEMKKRHDFTMNPEGSPLVAAASGMAFTLQLAASPAAALVNISQTTLVGVPMLAAQFPKATVPGILKHLTRASRDFTRARGFLETANVLTGDEKAAMVEAVRRGVIDKTQGHSLAELADHGVTHSPVRDQVTRALGFFFHHAERFNREVTFLTAYRLAKEAGMEHGDAIEAATDGTWASHFDVQNNARPRFMQNDLGKLLTVFKSFQVNMLWRMARDLHQTFNGATPELRREARLQFTGISLSMMAHAGIRGVWGYALITSLLALFLPGDDDDLDAWLQDALLFEGDSAPVTAWNFIMGAALNGAPGQITGTDLTNRIGMAELWFRAPYDGMRSSDIGWHYVKDLLGPSVGWAFGSIPQGLGEISEGEYWRGTERILPKAVRDPMKAMRYAWEGVETKDGDIILEDVSIQQMLVQASGFTPAQVSQRYRQAGLLRKGQREIETRRRSLHKAATDAMRAGKGIPEKVIDQIRAFNREVPEWPVTSETIRSSYRGREAAAGRAQIGVNINPRLTNRLNEALPQAVPTL